VARTPVRREREVDRRARSVARRARVGFAVAGGLLVAGAALPWADVSAPGGRSFTVAAFDQGRDGWITVACGLLIVVAVLVGPRLWTIVLAGGAGLVALGAALIDWTQLRLLIDRARDASPGPVDGDIGFGLWLTVAGASLAVGVAAWCLGLERK
jgi:hypothetical protein